MTGAGSSVRAMRRTNGRPMIRRDQRLLRRISMFNWKTRLIRLVPAALVALSAIGALLNRASW